MTTTATTTKGGTMTTTTATTTGGGSEMSAQTTPGVGFRTADGPTIMRQIGPSLYAAVNGGRPWIDLGHGVRFTTGRGVTTQIDVCLQGNDLYRVARYRTVLRGQHLGERLEEWCQTDVFVGDLREAVWQASLKPRFRE